MIESYSNKYKNVIIAGDFNMEPNDTDMQYFLDNLELYNLIQGKTCFKSTQGSCTDLMLTNKKHSFMQFTDHANWNK